MMAQVVRKDEPEVELTCRESQLLLETIPLDIVIDAEDSGLTQNQIMAVRHHVACNECLRIGLKLKDILGVPNVGCKEALEIWSGLKIYDKSYWYEVTKEENVFLKSVRASGVSWEYIATVLIFLRMKHIMRFCWNSFIGRSGIWDNCLMRKKRFWGK